MNVQKTSERLQVAPGDAMTRRAWLSSALAVLAAAMLAVAVLALAGCASKPEPQAAARFGSHAISEDEVTAYTAQYRAENGLEDDSEWKSFVLMSYQDAKTWREEAIRALADRLLIQDKAAELGVTVNEENVEQAIAEAKQKAGVASDDEAAWTAYLAEQGTTPEAYRDKLEFSSLEEQVYKQELNFTEELQDQMCSDYIKANFADQVMHRYWAIPFAFDDKARAKAYLEQLKGLSGDELRTRFVEVYNEVAGDAATDIGYIAGWDFLYPESTVDPDIKLRNSNLAPGELYGKLLKGTDAYRIVMCDEVVEFVNTDFSALESESMRGVITRLTLASTWAAQCRQYLTELEDAANIQVLEMPEGLPYDIGD